MYIIGRSYRFCGDSSSDLTPGFGSIELSSTAKTPLTQVGFCFWYKGMATMTFDGSYTETKFRLRKGLGADF